MNLKLISVSILITFINVINGDVFPDISSMDSFHTKVDYRSNLNKMSAYVEEFYNFKTGRGRVDVTTNGTLKSLLYDSRTQQTLHFESNKCTVLDLKTSLTQIFGNKFYQWTDASDTSNSPIIGPTALLRLVARAIKNGSLTSTPSNTLTTIRSIPCQTFTVTGNILNKNKLTFYFMDLSWNKFEHLNALKRIPMRVTISGTNTDNTPLNVDMDYFLFEPYIETWNDFLPQVGIGCKNKKSIKSLPYLSDKFRTTIELFDVYSQQKTGLQQYIMRMNVNYDGILKLVKIEGTKPLIEDNFKMIMDFNRGISYVFNREQACQIRHIQNSPLEMDQASIGFLRTARDLLGWKNDTYYLGKGYVRGIFCDVWERVTYNSVIPMSNTNTTYAKQVVTNYILDYSSKEVSGDAFGTNTPIKTVTTVYAVDGQDPIMKWEYNFFSFADTITNDDDMIGVFDVRNCFTESDMRKYIELYIPVNKTTLEFARKNFKKFKQNLVHEIAFDAQISPLRIPVLELDFGENAIMANAMILDKERASLSFKQTVINSNPNSNAKNISVYDDDECARKTFSQNGKGYHWCISKTAKSLCFIKTDSAPNTNQVNPAIKGYNCTLFMLDAVNSTDAYLSDSPDLTKALNNYNAVINKSMAFIILTGSDGKDIDYRIRKMIISDQIVVDIYGNSLFNMTSSGFVINSKLVTSKTVLPSAGNTLSSIGDCYRSCKSETAIQCLSFSFCRDISGNARCLISSILDYDEMQNKSSNLNMDPSCSTYIISYLNGYTKMDGKVILSSGDESSKQSNANLCAKQCTFNKKLPCKSFQYCQTGECFLRSKHTLDFDTIKSNSKSELTGCAFYSIKYLSDYTTTGFNLVKDSNVLQFNGNSAEECANQCSKQTDNCTSFNYCPADTSTWSYCELSTKSIYKSGVLTSNQTSNRNPFCRHYERNYLPNNNAITPTSKPVSNDGSNNQISNQNTSGMTSGSFFGLIFGLFFVGIIVGSIGYFGFTYYKKEVPNTSGPGLSVRFTRKNSH